MTSTIAGRREADSTADGRAVGDLRGWLEMAASIGMVRQIKGADWQQDIGAIVDIFQERMGRPALLFDEVPGFPRGYRVAANTMTAQSLVALTLGLSPDSSRGDLIEFWRDYFRAPALIPPVRVGNGPVLANSLTGADIDIERFPTPVWHELDGGRYIGTGSFVLLRDPDSGWVNGGTYRVQVQGKNAVSVYISKGKHGQLIMQKYFERGKPCPIVISCGHDPLFFMIGGAEIPMEVGELDTIGGIMGRAVEVVDGPHSGLPMPAHAELVIEGEITPGDLVPEGPFGEFTGYYASGRRDNPRVAIRAIHFRDEPIILGAIPAVPPNDDTYAGGYLRSALLWDQLEKAGVPGIQGVWAHDAGAGHYWFTISIKQLYPGHAKQTGTAAQSVNVGAYCNKYVVVVDDDIDPADTDQVIWAMCSRVDPREDVEILKRMWSTPLDPTAYPPESPNMNSRMVIDACRPWERRATFPPVARATPELRARTVERFPELFPNGQPA
jgi:4-hydroxy-3-polyprenylbenzoate decarboxylase